MIAAMRRLLWCGFVLSTAGCGGSDAPERPPDLEDARPPAERPNLVVVLVDDLRWDEFGLAGHPYAETPNIDRLGVEGARFSNAFHAVPLCSPNRASLLTGQYPSRHGIIDNVARNLASHRLETFPRTLQEAGYETAFVGKWHMGNDPTPRPGFDYWVALPGQGRTVDPVLYEDGAAREVPGYVTDILTDRALGFVNRERDRPFLLFLSHKGVHPDARQLDDGSVDLSYPMVYIPADRHLGRYEGEVFPRRGNVPAALDQIGSAASRSALGNRASPEVMDVFGEDFLDPLTRESTIRRRAEMLLAIDEGLGTIMEALEARGILDETLILFTSDNGYFFGEHGFSIERRMPYDESIRSPILIRYPRRIAAGSRVDGLTLSIDVAPTLLDFAGAEIPDHVQGRSLLPLLTGQEVEWRESVLVEFYTYENPMPWLTDMDYRAVRTDRYKYIHWVKHEAELYDLAADPLETTNLIDDPDLSDVVEELRGELGRLSLEALGLGGTR
ncbi:MAG TPA: sulfatase [Longimicrobiales bacterium]|nr:sulfatase [Longimicrobiales bacterium]